MERLATADDTATLDLPTTGIEQAEQTEKAPAAPQRTGVMGVLSAMVRKLREWGTPDGVDLDTADSIMAEHEGASRDYYRAGASYTMGSQGVMADRLMRLIEQRLPAEVASNPHVRGYFLERGGYMPYLA